jgi:cell division protein FtsZ
MTGVQSAQVLGPSTQKQADKSRASIEGVEAETGAGQRNWSETDGGEPELEQENGLDVIR